MGSAMRRGMAGARSCSSRAREAADRDGIRNIRYRAADLNIDVLDADAYEESEIVPLVEAVEQIAIRHAL